jgi:hypothetical protein
MILSVEGNPYYFKGRALEGIGSPHTGIGQVWPMSIIMRILTSDCEKEQRTAQLYYDLGSYIGNSTSGGSNYEACIVTSENALRDFPYASAERREQFMILILRSRYHLARQSVEEKRMQRFRQTVDEYYGFINEFPESAYRKEAEGYLKKRQKALAGQPLDED